MSNRAYANIPGYGHVFINSNIYRHSTTPDGKKRTTVTKDGVTSDITGFMPTKNVHNQFNITGGTLEQVSIGSTGPTHFNQNTETYEAGAMKQNFGIHGGTFVGSTIGGDGTYRNTNSKVSVNGISFYNDGIYLADAVIEKWKYDINQAVLDILKSGISVEDLRSALKMGHKIEKIHTAVKRVESDKIPLIVTSMLQTTPDQ